MIAELRSISSNRKDLVNFAHVMTIAFAVIAGVSLWRHTGLWWLWLGVSALFMGTRLLFPSVLFPLQKAWMALSVLLGWVMSRIVLTALYYVGFTTIGGIGRIFGKRFLEIDVEKNRSSYWIHRQKSDVDTKRYEQQF